MLCERCVHPRLEKPPVVMQGAGAKNRFFACNKKGKMENILDMTPLA